MQRAGRASSSIQAEALRQPAVLACSPSDAGQIVGVVTAYDLVHKAL